MKKYLVFFVTAIMIFGLAACGGNAALNKGVTKTATGSDIPGNGSDTVLSDDITAEDETKEGLAGEGFSGDSAVGNPSGEAASQQSLSERIAIEISYAEDREKEVERKQEEAVTQPEMNGTAEEMYQMWDDTLNAVWKLLEADLNETDMEALRKEESEWIASKDAEVQAAGLENGGGSLQPLLEAMRAAELTKARVYELAKYAEGM